MLSGTKTEVLCQARCQVRTILQIVLLRDSFSACLNLVVSVNKMTLTAAILNLGLSDVRALDK